MDRLPPVTTAAKQVVTNVAAPRQETGPAALQPAPLRRRSRSPSVPTSRCTSGSTTARSSAAMACEAARRLRRCGSQQPPAVGRSPRSTGRLTADRPSSTSPARARVLRPGPADPTGSQPRPERTIARRWPPGGRRLRIETTTRSGIAPQQCKTASAPCCTTSRPTRPMGSESGPGQVGTCDSLMALRGSRAIPVCSRGTPRTSSRPPTVVRPFAGKAGTTKAFSAPSSSQGYRPTPHRRCHACGIDLLVNQPATQQADRTPHPLARPVPKRQRPALRVDDNAGDMRLERIGQRNHAVQAPLARTALRYPGRLLDHRQ